MDEEELQERKYAMPDSSTFKAWCMLLVPSTVSLISIAAERPEAGHDIWVTIVAAISLAASVLMFFAYNLIREKVKGSKAEAFIVLAIAIFWIAALPSVMHLTIVTGPDGFSSIANANLYFASWGAFGVSIYLFILTLPKLIGEQFEVPQDAGKRAKMTGLFIISVVLLASAIEYAIDNSCSDKTEDATCRNNGLSFIVGIAGTVNALVALALTLCTRLNALMEAISSVIMVILYIFGVAVVTFGDGAGSVTVSNMYFAPWLGLLVSLSLSFEAIKAYMNNRVSATEEDAAPEEAAEEDIESKHSDPPSVKEDTASDDDSVDPEIHGRKGYDYDSDHSDLELDC